MDKKKRGRKKYLIFIALLAAAGFFLGNRTDFFEEPAETAIRTMYSARDSMADMAASVDEEEVRGDFYYEQMPAEGQRIYRELLRGLKEWETSIFLFSGDSGLISDAVDAVLADHPELFWMDGSGEIRSYELFSFYKPDYNCAEAERTRKQEEIKRAAAECLGGIGEDASEYEKVKYIYDYIVNTTEYDLEAPDSQNIYSVLVNHASVCAGYAKTMQYLLSQAGMECIYVIGSAGSQRAHAWNIVKCEGAYYQVDVTWGDPVFLAAEGEEVPPELTVDYDYLCCTDAEILKSHVPDERFAYPACTATECSYYRRMGLYYEQYDEAAFLQAMDRSIERKESQTVFKFSDAQLYQQAASVIFGDLIGRAARNLAVRYGLDEVRYAYTTDDSAYKIVILWEYE